MICKLLFPDKDEFKDRKNTFVNILEKYCRILPISDKNLGTWIRAVHFNQPIYMLFFIIFGPKWMADIGLLGVFITLILFIYLRGCWLSHLEKRICDDDINIVDAWLEFSGITIDYNDKALLNQQRYTATFIIGGTWLFVVFFCYYYRFIYK